MAIAVETPEGVERFERKVLNSLTWERRVGNLAVTEPLDPDRADRLRSKISPETQQEIRLTTLPADTQGKKRLVVDGNKLMAFIVNGGLSFAFAEPAKTEGPHL
jgi:hypothetical protein